MDSARVDGDRAHTPFINDQVGSAIPASSIDALVGYRLGFVRASAGDITARRTRLCKVYESVRRSSIKTIASQTLKYRVVAGTYQASYSLCMSTLEPPSCQS